MPASPSLALQPQFPPNSAGTSLLSAHITHRCSRYNTSVPSCTTSHKEGNITQPPSPLSLKGHCSKLPPTAILWSAVTSCRPQLPPDTFLKPQTKSDSDLKIIFLNLLLFLFDTIIYNSTQKAPEHKKLLPRKIYTRIDFKHFFKADSSKSRDHLPCLFLASGIRCSQDWGMHRMIALESTVITT